MFGHSHVFFDGEDHYIVSTSIVDGAAHTHRALIGCGPTIDIHEEREAVHRDRWMTKQKATCKVCREVELGKPMATHHLVPAHTPHRVVEADIPTGLPCPHQGCGAPLYIRRKDGSVGCTAAGHDFTVPEVLATSMGLLRRLATMGKE